MSEDLSKKKILAVAQSLAIHLILACLLFVCIGQKTKPTPKKPYTAVFFDAKSAPASGLAIKNPTLQKPKIITKNKKKAQSETITANAQEQHQEGSLGSGEKTADALAYKARRSPVLLNQDQVKIAYPEKAKVMMLEGTVLLRLTISEKGRVVKAEVLSGHFDLRKAALKLADKLFFLPATDEQGSAQAAMIEHEVVFRLRQS